MDEFNSLKFLGKVWSASKTRPSRSGTRKDGKICNAKPGECRFNPLYYTGDLQDEQSWALPISNESCPHNCPDLEKN